ncbi:unnamed protein product [Callosobruchus maculatus]|nr:unnamed protein product [Callosobruchus maculatus]
MFSAEHFDARIETWKLRGIGIFILYASCVCLAKLLKIMFVQLPILNSVLTGEATSFGNLVLSVSTSLLVIATAWILYRPMLGAGLLVAAISPLFYCTMGFYNVAQNGNLDF